MAARSDDSNRQVLIIALVFFVILSIGLGVATYYGFSGQKNLEAQAADAKKKEDAQRKARDWAQFEALTLQSYIAGENPDQNALGNLRGQFEAGSLGQGEKDVEDFKNLLRKLTDERKMPWDATKKIPADNFFARVDALEREKTNLTDKLAKANESLAKTRDQLEGKIKATEAGSDDVAKQLAAKNSELAALLKAKSKEFEDQSKLLATRDDENDKLQKENDSLKEKHKRDLQKAEREKRELSIQNDKMKQALSPPSFENFDKPAGRITSIDTRGRVAYLDLGSNDNVKPQLSFSVFGQGANGTANRTRKGAVEIVTIRGPHLSQARITETTDPGRNPIMVGDAIYNPAWSPTLHQHVAVTGIVDLTGDGSDNTMEFINNLERMGVVVDAYLDMRDLSIKGPGITLNTNYLVIGEEPKFEDNGVLNLADQRVNRKREILERMSQMKNDAKADGVPSISVQRFMSLVGYRAPRPIAGASLYDVTPLTGSRMERREGAANGDSKPAAKPKSTDGTEEPKDK
jgi:hypothetical protein